jgi:hypothetical protein
MTAGATERAPTEASEPDSPPSTSSDDEDAAGEEEEEEEEDEDAAGCEAPLAVELALSPLPRGATGRCVAAVRTQSTLAACALTLRGLARADLEDELATAAFQLHAACCALVDASIGPNDAFHKFVRDQLSVAPAVAAHLWAVLPAWRKSASDDAARALSLRLPAALLGATQGLAQKEARQWQRVQLAQLLAALPVPRGNVLRAQLYDAQHATEGPPPALVAELVAAVDACGWTVPVAPLGAALYSALVRVQWDDLDESSGCPVEEAPQLLVSLRHVWTPLSVGPTAHSAHCVFSAVQRWALGGSVQALKSARCVCCTPAADARTTLLTLLPLCYAAPQRLGSRACLVPGCGAHAASR